MKKLIFTLTFLLSFNLLAQGKSAYEKQVAGKAIIIDVREEAEVKLGMFKDALWIPLSKIEADKKVELEKIKQLGAGKEVYIYCRSGSRSDKVISFLKEVSVEAKNLGGFTSVHNEKIPTQPGPK